MHHAVANQVTCSVRSVVSANRRERGVRAVVALTAVMMVLEVSVGYFAGSMALLADGWHMATHVAALGLASLAYALSRRYAAHRAFAFGTGKVHALAGYTSAVALGLVAVVMMAEAAWRLFSPSPIDYDTSLPVAVLGLVVNLASLRLLHGSHDHAEHDPASAHAEHEHGEHDHAHAVDHDEDHDHEHHAHDHGHAHGAHDHNHRAAVLHVAADALTSLLAIVALLAGRLGGYLWLDPAMGIVGGIVILKWGVGLCKHAAFELLDVEPSPELEDSIRSTLEQIDDVRVRDLHVWSLGRGLRACIVTLISGQPCEAAHYREQLAPFGLGHLTVEVVRCTDGHGSPSATVC